MQQPPPNRPPFASPAVAPPMAAGPTVPSAGVPGEPSTPSRDLPSMADLDQLQEQLDTIDHTLADLDQSRI